MVEKGEESLNKSPPKKRKIVSGESLPMVLPIKVDKASRNKQLRLLKQRISKKRRVSVTSPQSSASSSSPSYSSYCTTLRHLHRTLIGRRSNSLKLAAKTSLNTSTRSVCAFYTISTFVFHIKCNKINSGMEEVSSDAIISQQF